MEFMGIAVGILALICALVLLFGRQGTRKILGWSLGLTVLGAVCAVAAAWVIEHNRQTRLLSDAEVGLAPNNTATAPQPPPPGFVLDQPAQFPAPQTRGLSDAEVGLAPNNTATAPPFDPSKPYEVFDPVTKQWLHRPGTGHVQ